LYRSSSTTSGSWPGYPSALKGDHVTMECWTDSQSYDGSNRWFQIELNNVSYGGSVPANSVGNQSDVGHC
jgi:hypothetical protein